MQITDDDMDFLVDRVTQRVLDAQEVGLSEDEFGLLRREAFLVTELSEKFFYTQLNNELNQIGPETPNSVNTSEISLRLARLQMRMRQVSRASQKTSDQVEILHTDNKVTSRQNIWLTVVSSLISLIAGYFLSALGPLQFFHH